jgi:chorismate-pyruvate lyase
MNAVTEESEATLPTTPPAKNFLSLEQLPFFSRLDPMVRVMLVSDGNLTNMLQAYFLEEVDLRLVRQHLSNNASDFETNGTFLKRQVVLCGKNTLRPYVYAESTLALNHLPPGLARVRED